jgi:valyl-tRNA synthetase
MWNASRLILLNADAEPAATPVLPEDRWILSRLQRATGSVTANLDAYDFSHAAQELYRFFWSELCDWYLEIVKPRLYEGEPEVAANLLHVLERVLALAHPVMPFVTEEIWSYTSAAQRGPLVVAELPAADEELIDEEAEAEIGAAIELTRSLRRWRDLVGVAAGTVLAARVGDEQAPHELVGRLARISFDGAATDGTETLATIGSVEILSTEDVDAEQVSRRIEERREKLRAEVERGERKLANEGFTSKAPADVVEDERRKLAAYRAELEGLGAEG